MNDTINTTQPQLSKLAAFRQAIYTCFLKAGDVLFEIVDALLLSPRLASFPELSCVPVFRRQWPSLYEGLEDGKVDETKLLESLTEQLPESERPLLVGDHLAWRQYLNRFVIEHWYRFIKQGLNWTLPRLGTPPQSELWSLLVIVAYWQLWLAPGVVADCPRPWHP